MRAVIAIVLLVCGVLLYTNLDYEQQDASGEAAPVSPLADANLAFTLTPATLSIRGTTASAAHESALREQVADKFETIELETEFFAGVLTGRDWEPISNRLLHVMAALTSGEALMSPASIRLRGVSSDADALGARIEFLRELLGDRYELQTDVVFVRFSASLDELCQRAFSELEFGPVSFAESSTDIKPGSLATLDRITDFAHDCQGVTIAITGHTDASGDETWNRQLSLARAQAVADHIAGNGIDRERLVVAGLGSSKPIADNSTALGRQLNRRIEFDLR